MSTYSSEYPFAVAFPPQPMTNVLAEVLAKNGIKQAHIAGLSSCLPTCFLTAINFVLAL